MPICLPFKFTLNLLIVLLPFTLILFLVCQIRGKEELSPHVGVSLAIEKMSKKMILLLGGLGGVRLADGFFVGGAH